MVLQKLRVDTRQHRFGSQTSNPPSTNVTTGGHYNPEVTLRKTTSRSTPHSSLRTKGPPGQNKKRQNQRKHDREVPTKTVCRVKGIVYVRNTNRGLLKGVEFRHGSSRPRFGNLPKEKVSVLGNGLLLLLKLEGLKHLGKDFLCGEICLLCRLP